MKDYFADLHIHIGWTEKNEPVKITASKKLTFYNILLEAYFHKGLDIIGIIDANSPIVQREIANYLDSGLITEHPAGGLIFKDMTIILGAELEIKEAGRGAAHFLAYFPYFSDIVDFSEWLAKNMRNVQLSSQRLYVSIIELQQEVKKRNGLFIPAHIFTPFKSVYGSCCVSLSEVMDISLIDAVELGLSSDTYMADRLAELANMSFLTNSDAHSLKKIGREYNKLRLKEPTFTDLALALQNSQGRRIIANYGLDPQLGKYHTSRCLACDKAITDNPCPLCGSSKVVKGVVDRISEIATYSTPKHPLNRPAYIHQIPLEFIPGLGNKTLAKLLDHFGTEMNILHHATTEELIAVIKEELAIKVIQARNGELSIEKGSGGFYGKVLE